MAWWTVQRCDGHLICGELFSAEGGLTWRWACPVTDVSVWQLMRCHSQTSRPSLLWLATRSGLWVRVHGASTPPHCCHSAAWQVQIQRVIYTSRVIYMSRVIYTLRVIYIKGVIPEPSNQTDSWFRSYPVSNCTKPCMVRYCSQEWCHHSRPLHVWVPVQ